MAPIIVEELLLKAIRRHHPWAGGICSIHRRCRYAHKDYWGSPTVL